MWIKLVIAFAAFGFTIASDCEDQGVYKQHCVTWKLQNYCQARSTYYTFMTKNCRKTCGFCIPQACSDSAIHGASCPAWRQSGYCTDSRYSSFMKSNCQKTCGLCAPKPRPPTRPPTAAPTTAAPLPVSGCTNTAKYSAQCKQWKTKGFCERDSKWFSFMKDHCKVTCSLCVQSDCGLTGGRVGRIIGGVDAAPNYWKWQVALTDTNEFFCGGSLIDRQWVLTAAHCTAYRTNVIDYLKAVLGEHDRTKTSGKEVKIGIEKIINHKDYRSGTLQNDIALIKLKEPAPLNDEIGLVCLPKAGEQVKVGKKCYISGWGKMKHPGKSAPILQQAAMPIVQQSVCQRQNAPGPAITKKQVCAGYGPSSIISGCHGDSGGPLVCENENYRYVLEGAVSWGSTTCDSKDKYTVFARISEYMDWIKENMK